MPDKQEAV